MFGGLMGSLGIPPEMQQQMNAAMKQKPRKQRGAPKAGPPPDSDFQDGAAEVILGDVRMFSGCQDCQTSADVSNVATFGLPPVHPAEKAGGACTNALLSTLEEHPELAFGELLLKMQAVLKQRKYTQIPQLSCSHQVNLRDEQYSPWNSNKNGRTRALLIGINYFGQKGELSGCVNDVKMMKRYLEQQGFDNSEGCMKILTDDDDFTHGQPTHKNIMAALKWLSEGMQAGDSLFFHYSGHGGQQTDTSGDEEDGKDETLIPSDYQKAGQISDDTIFQMMVAPLPKGVSLVCVFDCCHSGSILDLPFAFAADEEGCAKIESGDPNAMQMYANPGFNMAFAKKLVEGLVGGFLKGGGEGSGDMAKQLGMLRSLF